MAASPGQHARNITLVTVQGIATLHVRACTACGAIVAVKSAEGGGVIDNQATHQAWHAHLARALQAAGVPLFGQDGAPDGGTVTPQDS